MNARMDAAVTVDAPNAPTATWKTAPTAVSHSAHTLHRLTHEISDTPCAALPMPLAGRSAGDATGLLVDAARQPPCVSVGFVSSC